VRSSAIAQQYAHFRALGAMPWRGLAKPDFVAILPRSPTLPCPRWRGTDADGRTGAATVWMDQNRLPLL
jgi:hypothetical protein